MKLEFLSFLYTSFRFLITKILYLFQFLFIRKKDLEPAVKVGDKVLGAFSIFGGFIFDFPIPSGQETMVFNLKFPSPLIGASFKSDDKIIEMWFRLGIGGAILKTIMKEKRIGNPRPRLQDVFYQGHKGLINSLGLPGDGINHFSDSISKLKIWGIKRPIGISVGGDSLNEYLTNIKMIESVIENKKAQYFYELNISCPNTENGKTICQEPLNLEFLLKNIRSLSSKVISVKVSPDVSDETLLIIGEICNSLPHILINAGNTKYMKPSQVGVDKYNFSMKGGGLSGTALFNRTIEMVNLFANFKVPIMATGGISTIEHVKAAKYAGATLFGMATSLVLDPYCIPRINLQLKC